MADRWTDEQDRRMRDRDWGRSERYGGRGGGGGRGFQTWEDRSFSPSGGYQSERYGDYTEAGARYNQDSGARFEQGPVFGESETGSSYRHPAATTESAGRGSGRDQGRRDYGRGGRGQEMGRGAYGGEAYGAGSYGGGYSGDQGEYGRQRGDYRDYREYGDFGNASSGYSAGGDRDRDRLYGEGYFGQEGYAMQRGGFGGRGYEGYDSPTWRGGQSPDDGYRRAYGGERSGERRGRYDEDRGFWDRASDEVASWFGDRDAERRRRYDETRSHRGRGPKGYQRSDERISDEVHHRLTEDAWLDASDIDVEVKDGEVTLTGRVDDRRAKHRAEHCVEDVLGVKHVQNNLRVQERVNESSAITGQQGRMATNSTLAKTTDGKE
ncbi:BON domain-containing protein [Phenylobacterium sp.]|uniref:BON domain-containing protein n=1 Tax=Phenylobacterium sp. TaxID=1871053 RepID=UPI0025EB5535|nr:BON domain-containing protein [Phenylobacterium sp.]